MNWMPSKLGAEPKKIGALAGLAVIALVVYLFNRNPEESSAPAPARPAATRPASASGPMPAVSLARPTKRVAQTAVSSAPKEFKPSMKPPKDMDPSEIDPTLHLAALERKTQAHRLPGRGQFPADDLDHGADKRLLDVGQLPHRTIFSVAA